VSMVPADIASIGGHLSKEVWWPRGDWRHGDSFPLPAPTVDGIASGGVHYQRQRVAQRRFRQQRTRDAVLALNDFAAARVQTSGRRVRPHAGAPSSVQLDCLGRVWSAVAQYGDAPKDLSSAEALKELLKVRSLYGEESQHLARYDFDKLRVFWGDVCPKDALSILPPVPGGFLRHFASQIERGVDEIEAAQASGELPRPYWCPELRRSEKEMTRLFKRLFDLGLL